MRRSAGILLPIFSLPSDYGIGTFGKEAYKFVDFLSKTSQSYWQILPLGPTSYGDSPYSSFSTFALNPYFIDFDLLIKDKLIKQKDVIAYKNKYKSKINYKWLYDTRFIVLRKAYNNGLNRYKKEFNKFKNENKNWLDDYSLFMSIKKYFNDVSWMYWPDNDIKLRKPNSIKSYRNKLKDEIEMQKFIQFLAYKQYFNLKKYANSKGIKIIGDIPIYVPFDSSDVWSNTNLFELTSALVPKLVSGVPPDYFSSDGQLWGNPIFNWKQMKKDNYKWWINRFKGASSLFDVIRIDHFRGFESYWSVKYGNKTAKIGKWCKGPNNDLLDVIKKNFKNTEFIAEDLGYLTESVTKMLKDFGYPGMKVLEFAFDSREPSDHSPHHFINNSICYLGTHDNSTCKGWFKQITKESLALAVNYCGLNTKEGYVNGMIRTAMSSVSDVFIAQMQDYLELDDKARINIPGTVGENWKWRMNKKYYSSKLINKILNFTKLYGRI